MKNPRFVPLMVSLAVIIGGVAACKSLGTPQDQQYGESLWTSMTGYRSWGSFPDFEGWQKGRPPHGKHIRVYINGTAARNTETLAPGSIVVKENFDSEDESSINGITVMQRIAGYAPDGADWFYARYNPDGEMTHAGRPALCVDCHVNAGGGDHIFLNDE